MGLDGLAGPGEMEEEREEHRLLFPSVLGTQGESSPGCPPWQEPSPAPCHHDTTRMCMYHPW